MGTSAHVWEGGWAPVRSAEVQAHCPKGLENTAEDIVARSGPSCFSMPVMIFARLRFSTPVSGSCGAMQLRLLAALSSLALHLWISSASDLNRWQLRSCRIWLWPKLSCRLHPWSLISTETPVLQEEEAWLNSPYIGSGPSRAFSRP